MSTYSILLSILDRIREEAPIEYTSYRPDSSDIEKINQARAKAYIHLYLKAHLGILNFLLREGFITDGANDGGIDGYYIDEFAKTIYFLQSKFRTKETNFQEKEIQAEEILKMDINRILDGEIIQENGIQYNNKILEMQRKIREIPDIARYRYEIVILANLNKISESKLKLLTGGFPCKVFDYRKAYKDLVFPVVTGTYYNYGEMNISVNLSNKSAGAKINYSVDTELGYCDITVLFVPLIEIGRLMFEYKNSILKYNPRSFLTLKEGTINDEIRDTVVTKTTNEFSLFNNGITILSDETYFNEKIGQKDRAQLSLKNPQIINGGQTAYTLSLVYEEAEKQDKTLIGKLESKEVLLKVITLNMPKEVSAEKKLQLIEAISSATNKQNPVIIADRQANNKLLVDAQKALFSDFGILLERKRGEFYDGLRYGYINRSELIDRSAFMKIAYSSLGYANHPKKDKRIFTDEKIEFVLGDKSNFKKYFFGCLCYGEISDWLTKSDNGNAKGSGAFAVIALCVAFYFDASKDDNELKVLAKEGVAQIINKWSDFEDYAVKQYHNLGFFRYNFNYRTRNYKIASNFSAYYRSPQLAVDLNNFFGSGKTLLVKDESAREKLKTIETEFYQRNISPKIIREVQPLIDPNDWYDIERQKQIAESLSLDPRQVYSAIQLITSRDKGYFVAKYYDKTT